MKSLSFIYFLVIFAMFSSCDYKLKTVAELEAEQSKQVSERAADQEDIKKFGENKLANGSTPYEYCYGKNQDCTEENCSEIEIFTPLNSDVLVTIKASGKIVSHSYISAGDYYTFKLPNGTYQPFFYYGKGWNPDKIMKKTTCGELKGGFVANESFGKDEPQPLINAKLSYMLILQQDGNFSTKPSDKNEAL